MKKQFTIPVNVMAYTKEEAQANVDLLLQMGAFLKDFNLNNLAGSFITRFVVAKISEMPHAAKPGVASKPKPSNSQLLPEHFFRTAQKDYVPTKTKVS